LLVLIHGELNVLRVFEQGLSCLLTASKTGSGSAIGGFAINRHVAFSISGQILITAPPLSNWRIGTG
jgi:hypothetical protein